MTRMIALALVSLFAGCAGGWDEHGSSSSASEPESIDAAALSTCTAGFTRARECTDQYIPALVDLRVRLNVPAGIADHDREMGRPALVALAMEEWSTDSTDESIAVTCEKMVAQSRGRALLEGTNACLAAESCRAYVDCVMPLHEASFAPN